MIIDFHPVMFVGFKNKNTVISFSSCRIFFLLSTFQSNIKYFDFHNQNNLIWGLWVSINVFASLLNWKNIFLHQIYLSLHRVLRGQQVWSYPWKFLY